MLTVTKRVVELPNFSLSTKMTAVLSD